MTAVLQHPVLQALAWALVHFIWQGAALGAAAFLAIRVSRGGAAARYTIGVATLALMLVVPVVTTVWLVGRAPASPAASTAVLALTPDGVLAPVATAQPAPEAAEAGTWATSGPAAQTPDRTASIHALPLVVLSLWLVGVAVLSLRLAGGWVVARRLVWRSVRPASAEIQALARRVAGRLALDRIVRVVESSAVAVPVMIGWAKPVVLLPAAALSGLTPVQLEALLAHELAHIRRHDYLVNLLQSVVETLLFYHPAVWWVSGQVRTEREHCCDDLAVGVCDRLVYVTALADLATLVTGPRVALAATDGSLLARVRRILGQPRDDRATGFGWLLAVVGVLVAIVIIPVGLASSRVADHAPGGAAPVAAPAQAAQAGVQGGVAGGTAQGASGGVAAGAAAGQPDGVAGGVDDGVFGGVAVDGTDGPQGMPLTVEERARIQAELNQLEVERRASLKEQVAAISTQLRSLEQKRDQLSAAKDSSRDEATMSALQAQLGAVERALTDSRARLDEALVATAVGSTADNLDALQAQMADQAATVRALTADKQRQFDAMQAARRDLTNQQWLEMSARQRQMAQSQAKLRAEQDAIAARQAAEVASASQTSVSQNTRGSSGNFNWSSNGEKVAVKWTGAFRLSDDDKDIVWVEPGRTVEVSNGAWLLSTGVSIRGLASGGVEHTYYRNGIARPYEPEGRAFLADMLLKIVRRTAFGAQSRVARLLKQGGVDAVLAQIGNLEGDYARRVYYGELFKQAKLSPADVTRIATRASRTMTSDYELSTLLKLAVKQAAGDENTLVAVIGATKTIGSDYEMHQVLSAALPDRPTAKVAAAALAAASGIQGDHDRASFLIEFAKKGGLSSDTEAAFFGLAGGIHGSYERGRVLKAVMATPGVSASVMAEARKSSQSMTSDYDRRQVLSASMGSGTLSASDAAGVIASASAIRAETDRGAVLIEVVKKGGLTDATAGAFFPLVTGMRSSYQQRQIISAVLARPTLTDAVLTGLLKAAASVRGDFDRAEVLIAVAKRQKLTPAQRELYLRAADGIRSDYDQTRVLAELVRAERGIR